MASQLDKMHEERKERDKEFGKAFALLDDAQLLNDKEIDVIKQNLGKRKAHRPNTVDYLTRHAAYTFSRKTIHDITDPVEEQALITYNQALKLMDVVKACLGDGRVPGGRGIIFQRMRNMLKEVLFKYRSGITPKRDSDGNPLVNISEIKAAVMIATSRLAKKYSEHSESIDYIEHFMNSYVYVVDRLMVN